MRNFTLQATSESGCKLIQSLRQGRERRLTLTVISEEPLKILFTWRGRVMHGLAGFMRGDEIELWLRRQGLEKGIDYNIEVDV